MNPTINAAKYVAGLSARIDMGKNVILRNDIGNGPVSSNDISLNALWSFYAHSSVDVITLQICRVCLKFKSVPEQQKFIQQFAEHPLARLTKLLTIGSIFDPPQYSADTLAMGDYSIVVTNNLFSHRHLNKGLIAKTRRTIRELLLTCNAPIVRNAKSLERYFNCFNAPTIDFRDTQRLALSFQQFKEMYWPLTGPDVFSGLQALCDPLSQLSEIQLSNLESLTEVWGLRTIFYKLCAVRALGGFRTERDFLDSDDRLRRCGLSPALRRAYTAAVSGDTFEGYLRCTKGMDIFTYLIASFCNVQLAIKNNDLQVLKRQVAALFERDSQAHLFLNWQEIHDGFELPAIEADIFTIFLKFQMLHPTVARRFLTVAMARGKGHLVADLSSFISRIRIEKGSSSRRSLDRGNSEFIKRIRQLPRRAAGRLTEEILDKGMMERLAFAFPTSISLSTDALPRVDNQASILRLELANLALRANVLTERVANRIIEDEAHFLRMHKFQVLFREGRIKIDWDYLSYLTALLIEEKFDFLVSDNVDQSLDESVLANVARLFSEELSDILLFDSESSLEQALNNNVRHGVLVPRFVKDFNEALVAALDYDGHPGDLSDDSYVRFGPNAKHLLKLKENVTNQINAYKDFWLTVQRDGDFHKSTRELIRASIKEIDRDTDSVSLANSIIHDFEPRVDKVLKEALNTFLKLVKPSIFKEIAATRRKCGKTSAENVTTFLDILETKLTAAFQEISDWLGLAKVTTDVPDFELMDLIRFEAVSLIFSDFKKLNFTHASFVKQAGSLKKLQRDPRIKGQFFEVTQEIIHNLISNALKHSGLGMSTEINLAFIVDDSDLIFRCTNNFAEIKTRAITGLVGSVNKLIQTAAPSQGKKDELSGFSKIKNVCSRVLAEAITINVPPPSARNRRYTVEITIPNVTGIMLA